MTSKAACICPDENLIDPSCPLTRLNDGEAENITHGPDRDVCACGDYDWGACPKDTCHAQYEEESNA